MIKLIPLVPRIRNFLLFLLPRTRHEDRRACLVAICRAALRVDHAIVVVDDSHASYRVALEALAAVNHAPCRYHVEDVEHV